MAVKRKKKKALLAARKKTRSVWSVNLDPNLVREIWAIIYLAISLLMGFSLSGKLGVVGELLNGLLLPVFGWGVYLLPLLIGLIGVLALFAPRIEMGFLRMTGLTAMLFAGLGILHLAVAPAEMLIVARAGGYGGYVGFVIGFLTSAVLGVGGAYVVLTALFLVAVLVTFEISLLTLFAYLKPELKFERKNKKTEIAFGGEEEKRPNVDFIPEINVIKPELNKPPETMIDAGKMEEKAVLKPVFTPIKAKIKVVDGAKKEEKTAFPSPRKDPVQWVFPPLDLLSSSDYSVTTNDKDLKKKAEKIRQKLAQFGISVTMNDVHVGPTVVQFTLKPHEGVKLSRITALKNDLALTLSAQAIRIEAPIPGKPLVGIEVPNEIRQIVYLRGMMESASYQKSDSKLKLPIGRDVSGHPVVSDLAKMPHLLVAGATGSGKSVCMNSFLISLFYHNSPEELKFILIDPKRVELVSYNGLPHLLTPVITNPEKAATALRWAVSEMNRRYQQLSEKGFRNIEDHNKQVPEFDRLSKIIIVIDELADLMMAASKDVEASICRIAQMARAVGMHLIVATQRPSVDVITGLIKANIPARIAFTVSSSIDSRTIIDGAGAEDLLGEGDMLYLPGNMGRPTRLQGVFVSSKEINAVAREIRLTAEPDYLSDITSEEMAGQKVQGLPDSKLSLASSSSGGDDATGEDALYEQALRLIIENRKASASFLQRRLRVGYARAARLLDELEENGVIGPTDGAKPRKIFISKTDLADGGVGEGQTGEEMEVTV